MPPHPSPGLPGHFLPLGRRPDLSSSSSHLVSPKPRFSPLLQHRISFSVSSSSFLLHTLSAALPACLRQLGRSLRQLGQPIKHPNRINRAPPVNGRLCCIASQSHQYPYLIPKQQLDQATPPRTATQRPARSIGTNLTNAQDKPPSQHFPRHPPLFHCLATSGTLSEDSLRLILVLAAPVESVRLIAKYLVGAVNRLQRAVWDD